MKRSKYGRRSETVLRVGGINQTSVVRLLTSNEEFRLECLRRVGTQKCGGGVRISRKKLGGDNY